MSRNGIAGSHIIQSEVSQKEKNKCILTRVCGIWKNGTDESVLGQEWRCKCRELMDLRTQWGKGRVGQIGRVGLMHAPPCVKWGASRKLPFSAGSSAWCSGMAERDARGVGVRGRL